MTGTLLNVITVLIGADLGRLLGSRFPEQMQLTILGSIQDGLVGDPSLLAIKSLLDLFTALAFASTLGVGVAFAAATVLIVQGGIALVAMLVGSSLGTVARDAPWIVQMTAAGGR